MPHAHCYLFNKKLMLLHGGSDLLIGFSYVAISATLSYLVFRLRRELPFHWMMLAFALFIVACGTTHFMEVWTLQSENPRYWLSGWIKLLTAGASLVTAVLLPPLIPKIRGVMDAARLAQQHKAELVASEERFRSAIEYSAIGMALVGLDGRWLQVNRALCDITGYTAEELLRRTGKDLIHPDDQEGYDGKIEQLASGKSTHFQEEMRYLHKQGNDIWVCVNLSLVRQAQGEPAYFVSQIQDITERREAEAKVQASLKEKEVLLKEVHHRVKNNMQVISSILQLQAGYIHDPKDIEIFQDCQFRIQSMALVHERLYQSGDFATIDFGVHVRELAMLQARSNANADREIDLRLDTGPAAVSLDVAIPLGLIASELIANCFKHAFNGRRTGTIWLTLRQAGPEALFLSVRDDGIGLPADFDAVKGGSLGLRLIHLLSRQLRAQFSLSSGDGATMNLTVPLTT